MGTISLETLGFSLTLQLLDRREERRPHYMLRTLPPNPYPRRLCRLFKALEASFKPGKPNFNNTYILGVLIRLIPFVTIRKKPTGRSRSQ